jgi:hypothetical protein
MAFIRSWRNFKRMQDMATAVAGLIYAGAVVRAFEVLPGGARLVAERTLLWPAVFLVLSLMVPLLVGAFRTKLEIYVWMSFRAGFGQTPSSVIVGVGLLAGAALFIYRQMAGVEAGGRYPAGVFSAYAAGIGILAAQAWLVRSLERRPEVQRLIVERF